MTVIDFPGRRPAPAAPQPDQTTAMLDRRLEEQFCAICFATAIAAGTIDEAVRAAARAYLEEGAVIRKYHKGKPVEAA